jgi:serine protease Do
MDENSNMGISSKTIKPLGLNVQDISSSMKDQLKISGGVVVTSVDKFSDSFLRGVQEGVVIIEANKKKISNTDDLSDAISDKKAGDSVLMKVIDRSGTERIIAVKIQ